MKLPPGAHTSEPWRIHEVTSGFRVEDVWELPTPGGPDDFPRLLEAFKAADPMRNSSGLVRLLFDIRFKLGELFGWDSPQKSTSAPTLADLLSPELAQTTGPAFAEFNFLYMTADEYACELANKTVHAVMHLSWVRRGDGSYRGQMAVLVKPNGALGTAYMAAIKPFRYLVIYPAMLRAIGRAWALSEPRTATSH